MKRAAWYVVAGTVAGFVVVVDAHGHARTPPIVVHPAAQGPSMSPAAAAPGPASSASPGPVGSADPARKVSGVLEQYGYGELAVTVTVRGNRITDVTVPVLRTAEPYSQQLAVQVLPMLKREVLAAHSARIDAISGATYTSQAYADSIQSALDKLHGK
jgi:FMN-binding domain